jgi:hypothetical protein
LNSGGIITKEWLAMGEVQSHRTNVEMTRPAPSEVDVGTDMPLTVRASCVSSCDLRGGTVTVIAQDGSVAKEIPLASFEEGTNETGEFTVKAPLELGEYTWSVVFPNQEVGGVLHEESSAPFSFAVRPHSTSIAVWDVPSPIPFGDKFKIKVGVKCSAECNLTDQTIAVYGPRGRKVATETLGHLPWRDTRALYWAEVDLEAPAVQGYHRWRVKFAKPELELPHEDASYYFGFTTAAPPEHVVTVEVIDREAKTPLKNAMVTLRAPGIVYRNRADERGVAKVSVPKGDYVLYAAKDGYEAFETSAEVASDVTMKAELLVADEGPH